jgi:hypothetical protein
LALLACIVCRGGEVSSKVNLVLSSIPCGLYIYGSCLSTYLVHNLLTIYFAGQCLIFFEISWITALWPPLWTALA